MGRFELGCVGEGAKSANLLLRSRNGAPSKPHRLWAAYVGPVPTSDAFRQASTFSLPSAKQHVWLLRNSQKKTVRKEVLQI